jgi:hypothetical protein
MAFIKVGMSAEQISVSFENERQDRVSHAVVKTIMGPFGLLATAARRHYRDCGGTGTNPDLWWFNQYADYPVKFGSGKGARSDSFAGEMRVFKSGKENAFEKSYFFQGYMDTKDAYPGHKVAFCTKFKEFSDVFAFTEVDAHEMEEGGFEVRTRRNGVLYAWTTLTSLLLPYQGEWTPHAMLGAPHESA